MKWISFLSILFIIGFNIKFYILLKKIFPIWYITKIKAQNKIQSASENWILYSDVIIFYIILFFVWKNEKVADFGSY